MKMETIKREVKLKLLSPLSHFGDERMGTMQIMRTNKFYYNGKFIDVPVFSGNAMRGILRRVAMKDYLNHLGVEKVNDKVFYALFCGGSLTGGSRYNDIEKKQLMRKMCPPLSIFGTALGDQIHEGKLKSGIFKPICRELEAYTDVGSDISFYDMLQDVFYTRRDDLKSTSHNLRVDETERDNPVQMKYEMQCLSAGSELIGNLVLELGTDVEKSCLQSILYNFESKPYIGGKSATGHGEVKVDYKKISDKQLYYDYLDENKDDMISWIKELEGVL